MIGDLIFKAILIYLFGAMFTAVVIPTGILENGTVFAAALLAWPLTLAHLIRKYAMALGRGLVDLPKALDKLIDELSDE
jgi:hypothetical protein